MNETVEFTNLCMVRDGDRVLVIDRKKMCIRDRHWSSIIHTL